MEGERRMAGRVWRVNGRVETRGDMRAAGWEGSGECVLCVESGWGTVHR